VIWSECGWQQGWLRARVVGSKVGWEWEFLEARMVGDEGCCEQGLGVKFVGS